MLSQLLLDKFSYCSTDFLLYCKRFLLFPDADYLVTAFYGPEDEFPVFHGFDDLLDHCIIEGKSLRQILPDIEM